MTTSSTGPNLSTEFLKVICDPKNVGKICELFGEMPNIELQTMGGKVFWETLASHDGWKLQKNIFTGHCRILDAEDVRKAWGSEESLTKLLQALNK